MKLRYTLFFLLAFLLFLYLTFPEETLKQRIEREVSANSDFDVSITDLYITPTFDIEMKKIVISLGDAPLFIIDSLELDPGIFALMTNTLDVDYSSRLMGGRAGGNVVYETRTGRLRKTVLRLDDIALDKVSRILPVLFGLLDGTPTLGGTISGVARLELSSSLMGDFEFGSPQLSVKDLSIRNSNIPGGKFTIPELTNLNTTIKGSFRDSRTYIERLDFQGEELDLRISGVMPQPGRSFKGRRIDFTLDVKTTHPKLSFVSLFLNPRPDGGSGARIVGTWDRPVLVRESRGSGGEDVGKRKKKDRKRRRKDNRDD